MLISLQIKNYILIDTLRIEFGEGLNVFTGETGAGKSIIFDAIGILIGQKVSSAVVRTGANICSVSGEFLIDDETSPVLKLIKDRAIEISDGQMIIRREIDSKGRSRCFLNDNIVSVGFLSQIGDLLVDIHGQHQHQSLLNLKFQISFLDDYTKLDKDLSLYRKVFDEWCLLKEKLNAISMDDLEKERLIDLYKYKIEDINSAKLSPGDDVYISEILPQMKNAGKLKEVVSTIWSLIYEDENSVMSGIEKLKKNIEKAISANAPFARYLDELNDVSAKISDIKDGISDYLDSVVGFDEKKIDVLIAKLDKIELLKKKYGSTIEEILIYSKKVEEELNNLMMSDDIKKDVEIEMAVTEKKLLELANKISKKRSVASGELTAAVHQELKTLGMPKARFSVRIEPELSPTINGVDKVEFLFSANPGEDLRPLKEIISGGEMSRFMLALKSIESGHIPILIFDEIDSGLSGPMGQVVGKKLSHLAMKSQLIAITHLPQIAAFAGRHFCVEKKTSGKTRTATFIKMLTKAESTAEIARMLSGKEITESAIAHAEELIRQSRY